jgi:UDP-glucose 4-epimerase
MRIVILGYPGYIAHALYIYLKNTHEIICFGRSIKNATNFFHIDFQRTNDFDHLLAEFQPDWIIDTIGVRNLYQGIKKIEENRDYFLHQHILIAIQKYSKKTKYIYFSSRQEYGVPKLLPVGEDHVVLPISAYGKHKVKVTKMIKEQSVKLSIKSIVLKLSNVFGWMNSDDTYKYSKSSAINQMVFEAYHKKNLQVYQPGTQLRDYLYLTDLCELIKKILTKNKKSEFAIFNLGSGQAFSIINMAKIIAEKTNVNLSFVSWPKNVKDVETGSYVSNINLVKNTFSWKPTVNFSQGIDLCLKNLG